MTDLFERIILENAPMAIIGLIFFWRVMNFLHGIDNRLTRVETKLEVRK